MSFESEKRKREIKTSVREWIKSLGIALLASIFITTFVFNSVVVKGNSMYPTLEENDRLIVRKNMKRY